MKTLIKIMMLAGLWFAVSSGTPQNGVLTLISSSDQMEPYTTGYVDSNNNIVIPIGKYMYCYTEKFNKIAFIGLIMPGNTKLYYYAIDRTENILFRVASLDNGPDEVKNGLFRIIVNNQWGFANMVGEIVIQPVFSIAMPFSEELAPINIGGEEVKTGEYTTVKGGKWGFVNINGDIVIPAQFDEVRSFHNGKAFVKKDGESYKIDVKGNRVS